MSLTNAAHSTVAYSIRVSPRAKRARIEVSPLGQVKVIVPKRFNQDLIPAFIAQHENWILKTREKNRQQRPTQPERPDRCTFHAINEQWFINYSVDTPVSMMQVDYDHKQIFFHPDANYQSGLRQWLHSHARGHLIHLLRKKSCELALPFNKAFVKNQKTRWGSCSAKGNINLNRNLLFLPGELVNYLLVHELCHTVHLNHSPAYWRLVHSHLADYRLFDQQLRQAQRFVPNWALPES